MEKSHQLITLSILRLLKYPSQVPPKLKHTQLFLPRDFPLPTYLAKKVCSFHVYLRYILRDLPRGSWEESTHLPALCSVETLTVRSSESVRPLSPPPPHSHHGNFLSFTDSISYNL